MTTAIILQAGANQGFGMAIPMVLIIIVFYFFMIRPQAKKQKEQKKLIDDVKIGDRVVTTAGIHGKVSTVTDTYFLIEIDNNVKVKFDKSAISLDATRALNAPAVEVKK